MSHYIEAPAHYDRMPIDISFVFSSERPAGRHGFLMPDGDIFRFEDGTSARFWGVLFNGAANFPEHDYSERVAKRLAQAGVNLVRLHQLDAEWASANIYKLTTGRRISSTRELCEASLERLDYLIYCLKREGIYVAVDMMTYRKFKSGDGVEFASELYDMARFYSLYDPKMIELQLEYCDKFWKHLNPYTGLEYREDPAFVMCTITNENDLFKNPGRRKDYKYVDYYISEFRGLFADWLGERGIDYDAAGCDLFATDKPLIDFKLYLTKKYYNTMRDHIRSLGVRIPVTGTNWVMTDAMLETSAIMDYTDNHHYIYDWHWGENEKVTFNKALTDTDSLIASLAKAKLHGKPFFVSEWNVPWPNAYRALGAPYYAAMCCLQDWSGMAVHTYAYGTDLMSIGKLGKELPSSTLGGVPYREGIFSVWNDPAIFGLFYHSALMVRRGDVRPAEKVIGLTLTNPNKCTLTAAKTAMETHRVQTVLDSSDISGIDELLPDSEKYPRPSAKRTDSDTGELWRDFNRSIGAVDSPRTKIAYGFIGRGGADQAVRGELKIALSGMELDCLTDFGVIALSSLTDEPIEKSDNMLLSAIGRARNTGAQFDGEKLIDFGREPIVAEVIRAKIAIKTEKEKLRVWAVNADGGYVGMLDTVYEDGWLRFETGDHFPALYYLILEE